MNKIKLVGIDLAKRCYQVCALNEHDKVQYNRKYTAQKFAEAIQQLEPTIVALEACAAAHYWGRRLQALGHTVRLVPPQHAKAFRRVHKSDEHDALSIAAAAQRPNIHFVPVKTIAQQDLQMLGGLREQCVAQRTALINQARGYAREYGVNFPVSRAALMRELPFAMESTDNALTPIAREALTELYEEIKHVSANIDSLLRRMGTLAKEDPAYVRLQTVPGVGAVLAPMLQPNSDDRRLNNFSYQPSPAILMNKTVHVPAFNSDWTSATSTCGCLGRQVRSSSWRGAVQTLHHDAEYDRHGWWKC